MSCKGSQNPCEAFRARRRRRHRRRVSPPSRCAARRACARAASVSRPTSLARLRRSARATCSRCSDPRVSVNGASSQRSWPARARPPTCPRRLPLRRGHHLLAARRDPPVERRRARGGHRHVSGRDPAPRSAGCSRRGPPSAPRSSSSTTSSGPSRLPRPDRARRRLVPRAPIFLLCVARPELLERAPGWGGGKLNATTILLEALLRGRLRALSRGSGRGRAPRRARRRILESAGRQSALHRGDARDRERDGGEAEFVSRRPSRRCSTPGSTGSVPASVTSSAAARSKGRCSTGGRAGARPGPRAGRRADPPPLAGAQGADPAGPADLPRRGCV